MPLVTRTANQGVLHKQALEPSNAQDGDLWSDTTANLLKLDVSGTFQQVGKSSFSDSATTSYSITIGDYSQPNTAVMTTTNSSSANFDDDFTSRKAGWSADESPQLVIDDTVDDELDIIATAADVDKEISIDLIGGILSDTKFIARFQWEIELIGGGTTGNVQCGFIFDQDATNPYGSGSRDNFWVGMFYASGTKEFAFGASSAAVPSGTQTDQGVTPTAGTTYFMEASRDGDNFTVKIFSDSTYETLTDTLTGTVSGITNLRYLKAYMRTTSSSNWTMTTHIHNVRVWNAVNTLDELTVDDSTTTEAQTQQQTNPAIYVDCSGSNLNLVGCALYWSGNTTETEIQLRASTDTTFTSGEAVRTITTSNLTAGAWNFIRFNLVNRRYLQIFGNSGASRILAVFEIKHLTKTDTEILQDLGVIEISPTDTSLALDGT